MILAIILLGLMVFIQACYIKWLDQKKEDKDSGECWQWDMFCTYEREFKKLDERINKLEIEKRGEKR